MAFKEISNLFFSERFVIAALFQNTAGDCPDLRMRWCVTKGFLSQNLTFKMFFLNSRKSLFIVVCILTRLSTIEATAQGGSWNPMMSGHSSQCASIAKICKCALHVVFCVSSHLTIEKRYKKKI